MRRVSRHAEVDVLVRELNEWTHTSAFKPKWMRLHARSELGVAVQNQKRLLTSPTTPELLKRVVYVHFKYFCRCTLRSWAPLLCGCRKEFWHRGLPLSDALPRRTRRWSAPIGPTLAMFRCDSVFTLAGAGPRRHARAEAQLARWQRRRGHSSPWRPRTRSRSFP